MAKTKLKNKIKIKFADWVKPQMIKDFKDGYFLATFVIINAGGQSGIKLSDGKDDYDLGWFTESKIKSD